MRVVGRILGAALVLAGAPLVSSLDALPSGIVTVLAGALVASIITGIISPLTQVCGALVAACHALVWPLTPIIASGLMFALLHTGRAARAPGGKKAVLAQLAVAVLSGGAAAWVVLFHQTAPWHLLLVAVTVASLIASTPLLFPVDDHLTSVLRGLARRAAGTLRWRLERAASLRRRMCEQKGTLPKAEAERLDTAFRSLIRLAQVRLESSASTAEVLDESIAEHLPALERGLSAIDRRTAFKTGLENGSAEELEREAEEIEAEAMALAEVAREG